MIPDWEGFFLRLSTLLLRWIDAQMQNGRDCSRPFVLKLAMEP